MDSIEKAADKAASAQEKSDAKNNEFRAQLTEERTTYMTKSEAEQRFIAIANESNQRFIGLEKIAEVNRSEIAGLREYRSSAAGADIRAREADSKHVWTLGMTIAIITSAAAAILTVADILFNALKKG